MAVDAETGLHVGFRVRFADVAHHIAKTASFVRRRVIQDVPSFDKLNLLHRKDNQTDGGRLLAQRAKR